MLKCILIYLWIYIGLYYVIEAADADEHVHIKLHMPSGQRKQTQHHHTHHKKRQISPHHHHSSSSLSSSQRGVAPPHLYHETPHNYLTGITTTPQHLHHSHPHIKKLPSPHLHESGQLLEEQDIYGSDAAADTDGEGGAMMIPSYMAEHFAAFPQPTSTTTYETKLQPQNSQGFHVVAEHEQDNDITGLEGYNEGIDTVALLQAEEAGNYQHHQRYKQNNAEEWSKTIKNEQLLQQLLEQQHHHQQYNHYEPPEIIQAALTASPTKPRGNKYKPKKSYHSENDMTESVMYSSSPYLTATSVKGMNVEGDENDNSDSVVGHSGIKALTVDDIWSQLQRQYLSKYVPQAQSLTNEGNVDDFANDDDDNNDDNHKNQPSAKKKRTIKRQRHIRPASSATSSRQATSSFWPAKPINYENQHYNQQQSNYDDNIPYHSLSSSPATSIYTTSSSRDSDLYDTRIAAVSRPYKNNFNGHHHQQHHHNTVSVGDSRYNVGSAIIAAPSSSTASDNDYDDINVKFNQDSIREENSDDADDTSSSSHDTSFEENVYQRGKKFAEYNTQVAYGNSNTNNPFNYHDLYASYTTPITATVATKLYPSTYHPKLTSASSTSSSSLFDETFSPTLSHESTSYQWHTQQHNPASYQSYQSHHQQPHKQQHPEPAAGQQHLHQSYRQHYLSPQSSALRLPKATITQMPSTVSTVISSSSLTPTISNELTSSSVKSTLQPPAAPRYKKRKNRIKAKRNRIVVT